MIVDHVLAAEGVVVAPVEVQLRVLVGSIQRSSRDRWNVIGFHGDGHCVEEKESFDYF